MFFNQSKFTNLNTTKSNGNTQQATFETILTEEQNNRHHSLDEKSNKPDIIYGDSLQEQKPGMHFTNGRTMKIYAQQAVDHSKLQLLRERLDKLELQAEELLSKIDDETDIYHLSPEILQLLKKWSTIDSQIQNELFKNEKQLNVDLMLQSQDREFIKNNFIEKELHGLIEKLQNAMNDTELSNQDRVRFTKWINRLSDVNVSSSQNSMLSLLKTIKGELEQFMKVTESNRPLSAPLHVQLSRLITRLNDGSKMNVIHASSNESQLGTEEKTLWKELVKVYQKRRNFESIDQTDARVQRKDVSNWLSNMLERQAAHPGVVNQTGMNVTNMPMSKIEQYIIHLNQAQGAPPVDQQLIDEFQKILQTSKFLSQSNGKMQLSLSLRPENLGDMMVRFVQIDGDMAVKITVSSQAAKEMLEKNLHQLRNVFSPHQVMIERQELNLQSVNELQQNNHEEEENGEQQEKHQNRDESQHEDDDDFEMFLQEILMNERV